MSLSFRNQPPDRGDLDLMSSDQVLRCHGDVSHIDCVQKYARGIGTSARRAAARDAQRLKPRLEALDSAGQRRDIVVFHPAYHDFLSLGLGAGYASLPWQNGKGGHLAHAVMVYLTSQVEPGVCCPMTMTYAAWPALAAAADIAAVWHPRLATAGYDSEIGPVGNKASVTLGMAMTEVQGGSDVRSNRTTARRADGHYLLDGAKWFCSAPMSDAFLTLAQAPGGLTCFLVPRWLEEGPNGIHLVRLKDKLGNTSNASAEIEFHAARAFRIGGEGEGVRRIIPMVHHTRLDTAIAPAGLMRAALSEAHHWVSHRTAFERRLIDQPLMARLLADLVLDWEGATALGLHVARAFDDPELGPYARLTVALAKFLNNKKCPGLVYEAMEILGGNGYIEDSPMPMLFRESPLNSIWEGSGNVICLDILRTVEREPGAVAALDCTLDAARGDNRAFELALKNFRDRFGKQVEEADARAFAESLATLLTASILLQSAPPVVSDAYCATRLTPQSTRVAGSARLDPGAILARLDPD